MSMEVKWKYQTILKDFNMNILTPQVIYIETTTFCNADCVMCPHDKLSRPRETMPDGLFNQIIEGIREYDISNTQVFLHKEGEPLCDENIIKRISTARNVLRSAKEIGISTNAMLMSEEIADGLLSSGIDVVFFSVDGASAETYDQVRRNCKYETVERNIVRFLEKRNSMVRMPRVVMQMLVTQENRHEQKVFVNKWEKYDVEFYFKEVHCYLDGGRSSFEKPDFANQSRCCRDPFSVLVYHVDGRVGLCCWDYNCEYVIGQAKSTDMMALFNGGPSQYMREKQSALDCYDVTPCNRCGRIFGKDKISEY